MHCYSQMFFTFLIRIVKNFEQNMVFYFRFSWHQIQLTCHRYWSELIWINVNLKIQNFRRERSEWKMSPFYSWTILKFGYKHVLFPFRHFNNNFSIRSVSHMKRNSHVRSSSDTRWAQPNIKEWKDLRETDEQRKMNERKKQSFWTKREKWLVVILMWQQQQQQLVAAAVIFHTHTHTHTHKQMSITHIPWGFVDLFMVHFCLFLMHWLAKKENSGK